MPGASNVEMGFVWLKEGLVDAADVSSQLSRCIPAGEFLPALPGPSARRAATCLGQCLTPLSTQAFSPGFAGTV